jgi:hypothetical protein
LLLVLFVLPGAGSAAAPDDWAVPATLLHPDGDPGQGPTAREAAWNVDLVAQVGGVTADVAVQGGYAYLAIGSRLMIVDVTDPAQPVLVGQTRILADSIVAVTVAGDYA